MIGPFTMVRIIKWCPYRGERAQIVSSPKGKNGKYKVQVLDSLENLQLEKKDFVLLRSTKTGAR